jgi:hypothetical protein
MNDRLCGKAEVGREPGNGKLPPETFRLVSPNITKHLTARIRSEAEVQKIVLNFRNVLKVAVYSGEADRQSTTHSGPLAFGDIYLQRLDSVWIECTCLAMQ